MLCDVMLSARQCETWLTLDELARLTHYPPASISAQLQHLRKPEYGGFVVEKQPREVGAVLRGELAFDVCWEVYRGAREVLETKRGISALNWKDTGKFLWRPDFRPRMNEWVGDFALAGEAALDGPDWVSRMVLFRLYYLGLAAYENARHFLGSSEPSWVNWTEQIRHRVGKELLSRGMFPPRKYFTSS